MARKKRVEEEVNPNEWLNTYSDMVTLVLCFFVLMYTAATPDDAKLQWILQAFASNGKYMNPVVQDAQPTEISEEGDGNSDFPLQASQTDGDRPSIGSMPMSFDQLFNWISESVESDEALSSSASVSQSNGRIYIRFDSDVMFGPDSYALLPAGKNALIKIYPGIKAVQKYVKSVEVSGHTADLKTSNSLINDWDLSSMRAATVTNFLDYGAGMVSHDKFKTIGYAETQPYYPNDTDENRAKNRRVELVIIRNDYAVKDTMIVNDILKYDYNLSPTPGGPDDSRITQPGSFDKSTQIRNAIYDKYNVDQKNRKTDDGSGGGDGDDDTDEFGPTIPGELVITDDMLDPSATSASAESSGGSEATGTAASAESSS